jgi:murein L,D-transpeptidase YafK
MKKRRDFLILIIILVLLGFVFEPQLKILLNYIIQKVQGQKTVEDRVRQYGKVVQQRLTPRFQKAGITYPPKALVFMGFKQEKVLEVYASDGAKDFRWICSYPIKAASGRLGPKLKQGDNQVPEGLYRIELLNPNSLYHLSLRVSYPNEFDRARARQDRRTDLGGDIMIHGNQVSIGCIAVGDSASEDLFVLSALTGIENIQVILSPVDFRIRELPKDALAGRSTWVPDLYASIRSELMLFSKAGNTKAASSSDSKKIISKKK